MSAEDHSAEDSAYYLETVLAKIKQTNNLLSSHNTTCWPAVGPRLQSGHANSLLSPQETLSCPDSGPRPTPHSPVLQSSEAGGRGGN